MDKVEEEFRKLQSEKKHSVGGIVGWMKDKKLIDKTKEAEEKAKQMFADAKDATKVELDMFKNAVEAAAKEKKIALEDLGQRFKDTEPRLLNAFEAGVSAFKDAFTKNKEK